LFDNDKKQSQKLENGQNDVQKTFRKKAKELTEEQRSSLREGKTVHVDGLVDKKGEMLPETFGKAIETYTRQITAELLDTKIAVADENSCVCPKCKTAHVRSYPKVAKCSDQNCGLVVFRHMSEKQLSDGQITELLTKGKTAVIKGFKSKSGKSFDAALKFDENYRVTFDFAEKKGTKRKK
jgi:DNA topoisomerase-3